MSLHYLYTMLLHYTLCSPAGDRRSPLRVRMLIFKNIKFHSFLRVVEDAGPYINEVCANIVRSTVGRTSCSRRFFAIMLLKAFTLRGRWQPERSEAVDG